MSAGPAPIERTSNPPMPGPAIEVAERVLSRRLCAASSAPRPTMRGRAEPHDVSKHIYPNPITKTRSKVTAAVGRCGATGRPRRPATSRAARPDRCRAE